MRICARTTTTPRIRRHADKENKKQDPKPRRQINLCMWVWCFSCLRMCLRPCLCASIPMHGLPTRVRSHLTVISYSPETSGSRSCGGDNNGLSQTHKLLFSGSILDTVHKHAYTHTGCSTHLARDGKITLAILEATQLLRFVVYVQA